MSTHRTSISKSDLAAMTPEEAAQYPEANMPDQELEELATPRPLPVARGAAAPLPMADAIMEAVRQRLPAAELERLFALAERAADRQAKQDFNAALASFQSQCPSIFKGKTVDYASSKGGRVHYTFAPLEAIAAGIAPHLRAHGLSYTFTSVPVERGGLDITCHVRHAGGHTESATFRCPLIEGAPGMTEEKKQSGTVTIGMRNALRLALGLTTTDSDNDNTPQPDAAETITDDERQEIETAIAELRGDINRFCALLGVERVGDVPRGKLKQARDLIARKRADVQRTGGAA